MSGALQAVFQNQRSFGAPPGQQAYTTAGSYSWVAPTGVTRVSVVAIGGGGIRGGGGLGYKNNYTVIPGNSYALTVGTGTTGCGNNSFFVSTAVLKGGGGLSVCGGTYTGDGGGVGGASLDYGGGGAGGYAGTGGRGGGSGTSNGTAGAGGGGGGGASACDGLGYYAGSGGGVGILGQGGNGYAGLRSGGYANAGGGGSGGANGTGSGGFCCAAPSGGLYGGAGALFCHPCDQKVGSGANGAVRIIWPGCARSFPSTRTGNE